MNIFCLVVGHRHARERAEVQADRHWHSDCVRCHTPLIKVPEGWVRARLSR